MQVSAGGSDCKSHACHYKYCRAKCASIGALSEHVLICHAYRCSSCHVDFPNERLLDMHVLENHDSLFAVRSDKSPGFMCFVSGCPSLFWNSKERKAHLLDTHKYPPSYFASGASTKQQTPKNHKQAICRYNAQGHCRNGERCLFRHPLSPTPCSFGDAGYGAPDPLTLDTGQMGQMDEDPVVDDLASAMTRKLSLIPDKISFGRGRKVR